VQTQAESDRLNKNLSLNFKVREFICPCCQEEGITDELVIHLQLVHDILPIHRIMIITSGFRCEKHNKEIGGVENSAHLKGIAADVRYDDSSHKFMLIEAFLKVGFKRIGIYDSFIHVDLDTSKPQKVIW